MQGWIMNLLLPGTGLAADSVIFLYLFAENF